MSLRIAILLAFPFVGLALGASQAVWGTPGINAALDTAAPTFAPVGTLDVLSEASFTTLTHPEFPNYDVRIKKSNFCDEGVRCAQLHCWLRIQLTARIAHIPVTSTFKPATCSSTFLRAGVTPTMTT
jgi:hypothetical protein